MIFRVGAISLLVLIICSCDLQTRPTKQDAHLLSQMDEVKEMFVAGNRRFTQAGDTSYFFL